MRKDRRILEVACQNTRKIKAPAALFTLEMKRAHLEPESSHAAGFITSEPKRRAQSEELDMRQTLLGWSQECVALHGKTAARACHEQRLV